MTLKRDLCKISLLKSKETFVKETYETQKRPTDIGMPSQAKVTLVFFYNKTTKMIHLRAEDICYEKKK